MRAGEPDRRHQARRRQVAHLVAAAIDVAGPHDHRDAGHRVARRWSRSRSARRVSRPVSRICGRKMPMPYDPTRNPNCTPARISTRDVAQRQREALHFLRASSRPPAARARCGARRRVSHVGVLRAGRQAHEQHDADDHRRQAFDDEQPLPARQAEPAVEREQQPRQRAADHRRDRDRHHEPGDDPRAVLARETRWPGRRRRRGRSRPRRRRAAAGTGRSCWDRRPAPSPPTTSPQLIMMRDIQRARHRTGRARRCSAPRASSSRGRRIAGAEPELRRPSGRWPRASSAPRSSMLVRSR